MEISIEGRRALVTGANSGIGASIATSLADAGARVCVNYLVDPEAAEAVVAGIRRAGGQAMALQADIADAGQVARMFAAMDQAWGRVDILVNNAGVDGPRALTWEAEPAAWERVLRINLVGAFLCAQEALSGVILNMTSVHEKIAWSGYSAYAASKAGLSMLTKTMAQEAAPFGVRVLSLAPGAIRTPINRPVWSEEASMAAVYVDGAMTDYPDFGHGG